MHSPTFGRLSVGRALMSLYIENTSFSEVKCKHMTVRLDISAGIYELWDVSLDSITVIKSVISFRNWSVLFDLIRLFMQNDCSTWESIKRMTEIPRCGCPSIHQLFLFTQWSDHGKEGWILQTSAQQTLVHSFIADCGWLGYMPLAAQPHLLLALPGLLIQ